MNGTDQLARHILREHDASPAIQAACQASPEPLRALVYSVLGEPAASAIDGTELYHEIVDRIEANLQG